jgi:hypothetical protein
MVIEMRFQTSKFLGQYVEKFSTFLALITLLFCVSGEAAQQFNPGDVAALEKIKADNPQIFAHWADNSYLNWEGVTWNDASPRRVVELDIYSENRLRILDISGLTALEAVNCPGNDLKMLDLRGLVNLRSLNCSSNYLTQLDVSGAKKLRELDCSENRLTTLNVTGCTRLGGNLTLWGEKSLTLISDVDWKSNDSQAVSIVTKGRDKFLIPGWAESAEIKSVKGGNTLSVEVREDE